MAKKTGKKSIFFATAGGFWRRNTSFRAFSSPYLGFEIDYGLHNTAKISKNENKWRRKSRFLQKSSPNTKKDRIKRKSKAMQRRKSAHGFLRGVIY